MSTSSSTELHEGSDRGRWGACLALSLLSLLAACGSGGSRSLVLVTVQAGAGVTGLTTVEVTVMPLSGGVSTGRFQWSAASAGVLKAGIYVPSGVSGDATVSAHGFAGTTATTPIAASAVQSVLINAGAASATVDLLLQPLAATPMGDGSVPADASGTAGDAAAVEPDASAGDAAVDPGVDAPTSDAVTPIDVPVASDTASTTDAPAATPPSLTRCTEYTHTVTMCNLTTGEGDWGVRSVAFSPDGKFLVSAGEDGRVKVWRVTDVGLEADGRTFTGFGSSYAAFSPSGALLVVGTHNGEVFLYDFVQGSQAGALTGLTGGVTTIGFSSDGTRVVATDDELHLQVWDATTHLAVRSVTLTKTPGNVAIAPGAAGTLWVALQEGENAPLELLDLTKPDLTNPPSIPLAGSLWGLAFSPDGNTLAVGNDVAEINLINVADRAHPAVMPPPLFSSADQDVTGLAYSRDGQYLLAATGQFRGPTAARIFSVATRTARGTQSTTYFPWSAAYAPDGRSIAIGERDCGQILYCKD